MNLGLIRARGYYDSGAGALTDSRGYIQFVAAADWSGTSTPVNIEIYLTPTGSATPVLVGTLKNDGTLDMNSHKITSVADPTAAQDAATKSYVDANVGFVEWCHAAAGSLGQNVPASTTWYMAPGIPGFNSTGSANFAPHKMIIKNLYVNFGGTQPASGSMVVTLLVGGAPTALTITIPAGASPAKFSDTAHEVILNANDLFVFKFQNNATSASGPYGAVAFEIALSN